MKRLAIPLHCLLATLMFSRCATFLNMDKQSDGAKEPGNAPKKTLTISYTQYQKAEKEMEKSPEKDRLITQNRIQKILSATNRFSEIKIAENENVVSGSDLTIKFSAVTEVNNKTSALRILSIVTLGVVPMQFEQETKFTGEVFDKNGKKLKTTASSFQSSTWLGWIFLPLMPFYYPDSQAEKAFESMIGQALAELKKENIL